MGDNKKNAFYFSLVIKLKQNILLVFSFNEKAICWSNISKTSASVFSSVVETPMKHGARVFEITSSTKEN